MGALAVRFGSTGNLRARFIADLCVLKAQFHRIWFFGSEKHNFSAFLLCARKPILIFEVNNIAFVVGP